MRLVFALLIGVWSVAAPPVSPEIRYFRYLRALTQLPAAEKQTCVAIDPGIFAHSQPRLSDLRLYRGSAETPYAIQTAESVEGSDQPLALLNIGRRGDRTVFDAPMPAGTYGDVQLSIAASDFLATVTVSGSQAQNEAPRTRLGIYTIFDLTRQKLGRSTILHLPASDLRYLHFEIEGRIKPEQVTGLTIMRAATDKQSFLTVASSPVATQHGNVSTTEFNVPARTPVDRVYFEAGKVPANFSRDVRIRIISANPPKGDAAAQLPPIESTGHLLRVHRVGDGHPINEEQLAVEAPRNVSDEATRWTVTIENGDDVPISVSSIRLEMLERDLCFDAAPGVAYTMYYGDPALERPRYDYASLFKREKDAAQATVGPEGTNSAFELRPDSRPFTERHPNLLWVALAVVILLLGSITFRTAKSSPPGAHS